MKMLGEWDGLRDEVYHMTGLSFHHDSQPQDTFFLRPAMGMIPPETFTTGVTVLTTSGQYNS
jgi:hypothetical protein